MQQISLEYLFDSTPLDENIIIPSDTKRFESFLRDWSKAKSFALDLETAYSTDGEYNGLDPYRGRIRLCQISLVDERILIVDMFQPVSDIFVRVLKQTVANPDQRVIGQNLAFDLIWLKCKYGIDGAGIRDTQIMSRIRWCGIKFYRHGLKDIAKRLLGVEMSKEQQVSNWDTPNLSNSQLNYAAMDVIYTMRCYHQLCKELRGLDTMPTLFGEKPMYTLLDIATIECESIPAFVTMMYNGIPIDIEKCETVIKQYEECMADIYQPLKNKLGLSYSASAAKLATAIYDVYDVWLVEEDPKAKDDDYDPTEDVKLKQMRVLGKPFPSIPDGYKLSTSSSNLFKYYVESGESDLLVISLVRSLKKCLDSMKTMRDSALQNNGVCRTRFTSLGATATGRSTSSGDRKSSTVAQNLQNIPNPVEHDLLDKYNLPAPREVIVAPSGTKLSINDYSASHSRLMENLTDDPALQKVNRLVDPHSELTSKVIQAQGGDPLKYTQQYCQDVKKGKVPKDIEVAKARPMAKKYFYTAFNVGGIKRVVQGFFKDFAVVTEDDVKLIADVFKDVFNVTVSWQRKAHKAAAKNIIEIQVQLKKGNRFKVKYAMWRTPDGRLIHCEAHKNERRNGSIVYEPKISDVTSACLISPEALALKKTCIFANHHLNTTDAGDYVKLLVNCHDELVLLMEDSDEGRRSMLPITKKLAKDFNSAIGYETMAGTMKDLEGSLADMYSEK